MKSGKVGILYKIIRPIGSAILHVLYRPRLICTQGALPEGPFICCSNHISMWDPYALAILFSPRKTFFLAKAELEKNRLLGTFLCSLGAILVKRGTADISAIRTCIGVIEDGNTIAIFPEGTRNKARNPEFLPFHKGFALVAEKAGAPCVPIYIDMRNAYKPFHRLTVYAGAPVEIHTFMQKEKLNSGDLAEFTDAMRNQLHDLLEFANKQPV